nr:hydrolase [Raoultella sp. NCTC 9187]
MIKGEQGNVIWDPAKYDFVKEGQKSPDSVNPSLWRQSQLINIGGLFKVTDGVYQIRNLDLSNMTIIEGDKGITIIDPLLSAEPAKEGLDLYYANRGKKPVVAVLFTHSHVDHYGGIRGVVDEADVKSGKVKIYAPDGFMKEAVSEKYHGRYGDEPPRQLYVRQPAQARRERSGWRGSGDHHLRRYRYADPADKLHH